MFYRRTEFTWFNLIRFFHRNNGVASVSKLSHCNEIFEYPITNLTVHKIDIKMHLMQYFLMDRCIIDFYLKANFDMPF